MASSVTDATKGSTVPPARPRVFDSADECAEPPPIGCFERALVVDDDDALRAVLRRTLEGWGARVATAPDVAGALRKLSPVPELVLVDVCLPDGSGVTIANEATRLEPRPLVIGISGAATASEAFALSQAGVRAFLPKPFSPQEFATTITRALIEHQLDELKAGRSRTLAAPAQCVLDRMVHEFCTKHRLLSSQSDLVMKIVKGTPRGALAQEFGISENTCKKRIRRLLLRFDLEHIGQFANLVLPRAS